MGVHCYVNRPPRVFSHAAHYTIEPYGVKAGPATAGMAIPSGPPFLRHKYCSFYAHPEVPPEQVEGPGRRMCLAGRTYLHRASSRRVLQVDRVANGCEFYRRFRSAPSQLATTGFQVESQQRSRHHVAAQVVASGEAADCSHYIMIRAFSQVFGRLEALKIG